MGKNRENGNKIRKKRTRKRMRKKKTRIIEKNKESEMGRNEIRKLATRSEGETRGKKFRRWSVSLRGLRRVEGDFRAPL